MLVYWLVCLKMSSLSPKGSKRKGIVDSLKKCLLSARSVTLKLVGRTLLVHAGVVLGVVLKASVGDAARFCALRDC